jgi:diacylglycerol kinase (ATP)
MSRIFTEARLHKRLERDMGTDMTRKALLLINRHARKGKQEISSVIHQLQELGLELLEAEMPPPSQLSNVIRRY